MFLKNVFKHVVLTVFTCLVFISPAFSSFYQNSYTTLENGLSVVVTEMPSSSMVSVYALVKTGSATEDKFLGSGISHFFEHMLFKTTTSRAVGEISADIQAVGGTINASTGLDYTIYTITVPKEAFDTALDVLSDMLMNITMDPQEVEKERQVILGEMRLYRDNPDRELSRQIFQHVYIRHPYQHPVIGYEPLFSAITRDDLVQYYKTHYSPNNIVFSVAGGIRSADVLPKIEDKFRNFKRQTPIIRNLLPEPTQLTSRFFEFEYPTDLARFSLAYSGVSLLDEDMYALDVLAVILGQGASSKLYQSIYKDKQLVYSISASNFTPTDRGVFEIEALLDVEKIDAARRAIDAEIEMIKKHGVKKQELEKVKKQVLSDRIYALQASSSVAYAQAVDAALTGDPQFSDRYIEAIKKLTVEDVKRVALQYLVPDKLTTVILKPKQRVSGQDSSSAIVQDVGPITKKVLDNGLKLLWKKDPHLPIVSIHLVMQAGTREDPSTLNGLSLFTAEWWLKGTRKYSSKEIAEKVESLGMSLDTFSGKNSLGLNMTFLKEDFPTALALLEELVLSPNFPQDEFGRIQENLLAAIKLREDNISQKTNELLKQTLFQTHPLRLEDGGTTESINRIKREDVLRFFKKYAVAHNMVFSVFGDIDEGTIIPKIENILKRIPDNTLDLASHAEEPVMTLRVQEQKMDKEQAMLIIGFHGPTLTSEDRFGVEVLTSLLGSSFSGRLFNRIREQFGQAYTLGGSFIPGPDLGLVYFYVLTNQQQLDAVKASVMAEIQKIQDEPVPQEELRNMKNYLKGTFKEDIQTIASLSLSSSLDELYGLGFDFHQKYESSIDAVTQEDIQKLAQKYLGLQKAALAITNPPESATSLK
jgi:zinc protease